MYDAREKEFIGQAQLFGAHLDGMRVKLAPRSALAVRPIIIRDIMSLTEGEVSAIADQYASLGVSYFVVITPPAAPASSHPLFSLARQLSALINLSFPLRHPLEYHPETLARFGACDGTVKVYNLEKAGDGYREQGETSGMFDMHHDGLGSSGTVENIVLYMDSAPLWGGMTYFQNMMLLAFELRDKDVKAFESLFLPDALTISRPRGKGSIKVITPVLYMNECGKPQSAFRRPSGEYIIKWRRDPALLRARDFLEIRTVPFAAGSMFVNFTGRGHGCVIRNDLLAHGRTDFLDDSERGRVRVLSRKWFMRSREHAEYRHVPGTLILPQYAVLYPDLFGEEVTTGEWLYSLSDDRNFKKHEMGVE